MRYMLECETNAQRISILDMLDQKYTIGGIEYLFEGIESEHDFKLYPWIIFNDGDASLTSGYVFPDDVVMTEEEFMKKFLPERDIEMPRKILSQKFNFV